jgi:hypothetical protein
LPALPALAQGKGIEERGKKQGPALKERVTMPGQRLEEQEKSEGEGISLGWPGNHSQLIDGRFPRSVNEQNAILQLARLGLLVLVILWTTGCVSAGDTRDQYLLCPHDTVWDAALEAVKDRPLEVKDKEKGQIETAWVEMAGNGRTYGVFAREAFGDKERARMTLIVKRENDVTIVSLNEYREQWHRKGGITQQAMKWWPIEPSEEAVDAVVNRLNKHLKERGCPPV